MEMTDVTLVKHEGLEEIEEVQEVIKIEQGHETHTIILQNVDTMPMSNQMPGLIINDCEENSDGLMEVGQEEVEEEEATYTYIIENADYLHDDTAYEIHETEDGEHYIIEEYQAAYDDSQDVEYETAEIYQMEEEGVLSINENHSEAETEQYEENENSDSNHDAEKEYSNHGEENEYPSHNDEDDYSHLNEEDEENDESAEIQDLQEEPVEFIKLEEPDSQDETEEVDDEILECDICHKTFKTTVRLKRHITVCHNTQSKKEGDDQLTFQICQCCGEPIDTAHTIGEFKCEKCEKLFVQQNGLDRHTSIEHPAGNLYECVECKQMFEIKEQLLNHMRVHPFKSVKCDGCGREFTRKYHLDRHIGQTGCTGIPKAAFECRVCKKFFTRKDNLAEHLRSHAGIVKKKKSFTCDFCKKEFQGLTLLNIHIRTHTGEKPYHCDICPKNFPSSGAMKKHRRMHTGEKPYQCEKCDKRFAAKETLNRHWRTHTGEKPHVCKFCGKSFIQASQLRAHIFHHTGENAYTCPHCSRAFNRKLRLTTHIRFMHEGAQPLTCTFPDCGKTFFRKEDVSRHMLIHTGVKPYACDICDKSFVVKSSLKIHQLTHRKEPPVSCDTCGRAFIRQDCLMRHMRSKHRDVLEDIMVNAEKKRLQQQLLSAATNAASKGGLTDSIVWNELTLTESVKELLTLLVDEECLQEFGHPDAPVDKVLDSVIKRCGHQPASEERFDYIGRMRENAKLLFTVVIDDEAVKELLNNQTVDEVILHVLRLAKKQGDSGES